ncbi:exported protein of unknown function [Candidatus Saccharimonas aalborgensis]|jgi:hypothetical protein|uniref:PEGA domain-containing protein n=1 Tax=Candidatus Saccharimonas aalborgensis TaxID=1332188 RepID=R4PVI3_9BACT|nr:exported protein of unknown function [Candidatus Saccharimonas aalborgensis]AGL62230.1 exported protein of unknown function [Candidatus Saccharimonas aalborgensis]QQS68739.1 MAG: hypothetical protein IPP24_01765 [Candidatus Saccharibacteria bacterium]QQS71024.1 MAG: hypothetical protein IPP92_01900 [Candidatus Saccharibacteria bacterium]
METQRFLTVRTIIATSVVLLLGVCIIFLVPLITRAGKQAIGVYVAPKDSTVMVDGLKTSDKTLYLTPGTHRVTVTKDGFSQSVQLYEVKEGKSSDEQVITAMLEPKSDDAKKWYQTNTGEYLIVEGVIGNKINHEGDTFRSKNPIVDNLPYNTMLYTIGYKNDPSDQSGSSIILTISAPAVYRNAAINQISNWGYNPVDYKIVINNERNPFTP